MKSAKVSDCSTTEAQERPTAPYVKPDRNRRPATLEHGIVAVPELAELRLDGVLEGDAAAIGAVTVEHNRLLQIDFLHVATAVAQSVGTVRRLRHKREPERVTCCVSQIQNVWNGGSRQL